jgi:O-antigen ligase/tetratricopeptide (TPR) repeat protein
MIKESTLKNIILTGLILLLFTPLIVNFDLFFPYITGKAYFFRLIVEIVFGLWLILAVLYPEYRPKKSLILGSTFIFLIFILISNVFGINQTASFWSNFERMEGYVTLVHLFGLLLVMSSVLKTETEWIRTFQVILAFNFVTIIQSFAQIFEKGINYRIDTTLGNSTYLAVYMLFAAFISLYLISKIDFTRFNNWWNSKLVWVYGILFLIQSFLVFQTGTRGAMLGLLGGLSLIVISYLIFSKNKQVKKISVGVLVIIIAIVVSVVFFRESSFVKSFGGLQRLSTISLEEGTAKARLINWSMALDGIKEKPILGWGQSNYNIAFDKYYRPEMHGNEVWFDRTHNIILDWAIAGGIWGLIAYLFIWLSLVYLIIFKTPSENAISKSILVAMVASYFVHNLFVFDNLISYMLFFAVLAYVASQNQTNFKSINLNKEFNTLTVKTLIPLVIILIPVTIYAVNYDSYKANKELISAMRISKVVVGENGSQKNVALPSEELAGNLDSFLNAINRDTFGNPEIRQRMIFTTDNVLRIDGDSENINTVKQSFLQNTVNEMLIQIEEAPYDSRYTYLLGSMFARVGQSDLAEQQLLKTINLAPNKQAMRLQLLNLYRNTKQSEKALSLAKETYELDMSKDDIWIEYATTASMFDSELFSNLINEAISNGEIDKVEDLMILGTERSPDNPQSLFSLAAFYNRIGDVDRAVETLDLTAEKFPETASQVNSVKAQIH